jgi:outer membrane protein OmpU
MASNVSFAGSGELDNGWSVDLSIAYADGGNYSNTNVTIGFPGIGDLRIDQGTSGTGIQRYDDITPTVWEEADGAGKAAGINKIMGTSAGGTLEFKPANLPDGLVAYAAYSADSDSGNTSDKVVGGDSGALGSGWDLMLEATSDLTGVDGLTLYGGISEVDQAQNAAALNGDVSENVYGIKYAMGSFAVGWQQTEEETGVSAATNYENTSYGITFSVNDDLSIGYNHVESSQSTTGNPDAEADSLQASYTMGGATLAIAEVDVENAAYSSGASADSKATILYLGLAF